MIKKSLHILLIFILWCNASMQAQPEPSNFVPYASTDLRLPSVPLFTNNPYFSLWSPFDRLNDGTTRHWSDAEKAMDGLLRVDGTTYRFMGVERKIMLKAIAPMASKEKGWTAKVTHEPQHDESWAAPAFDDRTWNVENAAWGTIGEYPHCRNRWDQENSDIYLRRTITLSAADLKKDLYLQFSHDDAFEIYLNGHRIISTGETWVQGEQHNLTSEEKSFLKSGKNIIAAHCHNNRGGAYADFGLFENTWKPSTNIVNATQKSVDVLATSTYYTFTCGPVELDLAFTTPMLINDLEQLSTPVNYLSYQVRSTDGKTHDVQFYFATSPQLVVNEMDQPTRSEIITVDGVRYLKSGSIDQPILGRSGDLITIDWGYLYIPEINGTVSMADANDMEKTFAGSGKLSPWRGKPIVSSDRGSMPVLAFLCDMKRVDVASNFMLIGYDEVKSIRYMDNDYKGYWARNGKTIFQAFTEMRDRYHQVMYQSGLQDKVIFDDALKAGGRNYAELLSGCYRHVMAAHQLFEDNEGNLLYFSKENNSNGCVNTVDLTYPESPLYLCYNPDLQKAMIRSVLNYCKDTRRWGFADFAAHDLGTYPHANGQVYAITKPDSNGGFGGNMPIEESGNLLILIAEIAKIEGNTRWIDDTDISLLHKWADYLVANGQDPQTQLCTDDFAGHWGHNANLAAKAIMGVAAFAEILRISGAVEQSWKPYAEKAKQMAMQWEIDAEDGDHYKLAFDRPGTWSIKYNLVWDKLWGSHLFSDRVIDREISYYLKQQNEFGLPLDCRKSYSKTDWIMWAAAMAPDNRTFQEFADRVYHYVDKTPTRWPISDWYWTDGEGAAVAFRARSVAGGHWMKVLMDKKAAQAWLQCHRL